MQGVVRSYDEASRKELATKGDIADVRQELRETCSELKMEIARSRHEILKWVISTVIAQTALVVAVIAAGFALVER